MIHSEGVLLGVGNPLLDIILEVDKTFLTSFGLVPDEVYEMGVEDLPKFKEFTSRLLDVGKCLLSPGGSAQNVIRIAQWILKKPFSTSYFGAVGNDEYGIRMYQVMTDLGVNCLYQVVDDDMTGVCASLVAKKRRTLVAYVGASTKFNAGALLLPRQLYCIDCANCVHVTGYFVAVNLPAVLYLAEQVAVHDKVFSMRLGGGDLHKKHAPSIQQVIPYVDLLFGSAHEVRSFARHQGYQGNTLEEIAMEVAQTEKRNGNRQRLVIFTQSAMPVIVVEDGELKKYDVPQLYSREIKDPTGAGDAFIGGFLAQYIQGRPTGACIKCGMWAAREVMKNSGCTFSISKKYGSVDPVPQMTPNNSVS